MASIDLHGHDVASASELIGRLVREAWEMGENELTFIHGHGLGRALRRPFANTNTGNLGLAVRSILRDKSLRPWMFAKIDVSDPGCTTIRLRRNPAPSRADFDPIPAGPYAR
jgi:hypothetical protein